VKRPCLDPLCGELIEAPASRCDEHRIRSKRIKPSAHSRGYTAAWQRLSRAARAQQHWCLDCGRNAADLPTNDGLRADHTPEAWARQANGLPIRLQDIAIRCGACNRLAGAARGDNVTRT
jgi:5-methylcytosine-specific restriction enzyme A